MQLQKTQMLLTKNRKHSSENQNGNLQIVRKCQHAYQRWSYVRYTTPVQHVQLTTNDRRKVSNSIRSMER